MQVEIKKLKESEAEEKIDINIKIWWQMCKTTNFIILGFTLKKNTYYHDNIKESLRVNKNKQLLKGERYE